MTNDVLDDLRIDALEKQINDLLFSETDMHGERIVALLGAMSTVLFNIACPDCRKISAETIRDGTASMIKETLESAAKRDLENERNEGGSCVH